MIRLTLILAAVILGVLVIVPREIASNGAAPSAEEEAGGRPARPDTEGSALRESGDGGLVLVTAAGEELPIARVIEPSALTEADAVVNLPPAESSGALEPVLDDDGTAPQDGETAAEADAAPVPDPAGAQEPADITGATRLVVTGDRVNFRAGPSTEDAVLAALTQGTVVELLERVGDGWAHLRVFDTALTGYMSEDFLAPAN